MLVWEGQRAIRAGTKGIGVATTPQSNLTPALFGLAAFAVFSVHDVIIKVLGSTYSPFQIVFFGALFSFPIITLMLIGDQTPGTLRPVHPWLLAVRSLSGSASAVSAFYAFSVLPLTQAYAILFASPLLITLLAIPILGETVRLRRGLAVLVGMVGVLVVLRPGSSDIGPGHIAALVSAMTGALNSILVRKIGSDERSVVMVLYPMMTNFTLMGIALPFVYRPMPVQDLGLLAIIAALLLLAMTSLVNAYRRGNAVIVAPMQYSQMLWATLFGTVFFGEFPDGYTFTGGGIIILSGLYILRREATGDVSMNRPVLRTRTRIGLPAGLRVGSMIRRDRNRK